VLHISQKDLSERHAETVHIIELARALHEAGVPVRAVVPGLGRYPQETPFEITYLPALKHPRLLRLLSYEASLLAHLLVRLRSVRRAGVYVRKGLLLLSPLLLARLVGGPAVLEVNGTDEDAARQHGLPPAATALLRLLSRGSYALARHIVVVTDTLRDYLAGMGVPQGKIHVVPNGANTRLFRPLDAEECRRSLGLEAGGRYVCFVGQMAKWQGLDLLLAAAAALAGDFPDLRVLLVGGGEERAGLEAQTERLGLGDRVVFRGPVGFEEVPLYLGAATVCVAPLVVETHSPLKLFEYLACARPVVASDVAGVREVVQGYGCGWLAEPGSAEDLAARLAQGLRAAPEEREAMGRRGREAVVQRHSWDHAARLVMPLLTGGGRG
jgi:glycosyltransferase involved in cell wall biosynthesis